MMKQLINAMPQRIAMLLCALILSVGAFAQQIVVKGHVKDDTGEPITGATVRVVGQEGGVVTDIDGNFSISANTGAEITVSYIGYSDTKAPASANMVIVMKDDAAKSLNEVVVIGYGVVKKSDLTGSVEHPYTWWLVAKCLKQSAYRYRWCGHGPQWRAGFV